MNCYGCYNIMNCELHINGRIDTGEEIIAVCCERLPKGLQKPAVSLEGSAEEILNRFLDKRNSVIDYLQKEGDITKATREYELSGCERCNNFKKDNWDFKTSIEYINMSMYPAPCQCNCFYCTADRKWENTPEVKQAYEKMFEVIELADKKGLISPDATWQISSGEITIHPYRDKIMSLVDNKRAVFYTNAFIYDEDIARNLSNNRDSKINFSIDAGTSQTWARIKGVNNFNEVCENLFAYRKASISEDQIQLKYIVLPGINDSEEDYKELIKIMKKLNACHLIIARDSVVKYTNNRKETRRLLKSAARLSWFCLKNNINIGLFPYSSKEQKRIRMIIRLNRLKSIFKRGK